jgi:hypothetical protein
MEKSRTIRWFSSILALVLGCGLAASASAVTITADAGSAYTPEQLLQLATPGQTTDLQNSDFLIQHNPGVPASGITGDGWDEHTLWSFNLTGDPGYASFVLAAQAGQITSAQLTLNLTTWYATLANPGPITDVVVGQGLAGVLIPPYLTAAGQSGDITLDLLSTNTPGAIMSSLLSQAGLFAMEYADDAVVNHARLVLTAERVPEPATLLLAGPVLLVGLRRRARR